MSYYILYHTISVGRHCSIHVCISRLHQHHHCAFCTWNVCSDSSLAEMISIDESRNFLRNIEESQLYCPPKLESWITMLNFHFGSEQWIVELQICYSSLPVLFQVWASQCHIISTWHCVKGLTMCIRWVQNKKWKTNQWREKQRMKIGVLFNIVVSGLTSKNVHRQTLVL